MTRGVLVALALGLGLSSGCAGRKLDVHREPGGNLLALTAKQGARADRHHQDRPLVVMIEDSGLRAVDPSTASDRWTSSLRATGHLTANETAVFVPLSGHRLAALDRTSGAVLWKIELPGEALSGVAANGRTVVVSVLDHRKGRSRAVGISALDGQIRWMRRTEGRLGSPAVVGTIALVPVGNQVVALGTRAGWERGRLDLGGPAPQGDDIVPAVERVSRDGGALYAGTDRAWVDLQTATSGHLDGLREIQGYGEVFSTNEGLDAGHADAERLRLWVDLSATTAGHRDAVFVCRRAVVAMRVDEEGTPRLAQWTYLSGGPEFVGFDVRDDRVVLVREDGLLVQLSRTDGAELDRVAGAAPTRGALMLDLPDTLDAPRRSKPQREQRLAMMRDLILDSDPRLVPAQRLAIEILWRDDDADVRDAVARIAHGEVRDEPSAASAELRAHAAERLAEPWGTPDADQIAALRRELAARPSFLTGVRPPVAVLARRAVAAGELSMVADLVELLNHPSTEAADLDPLVRALGELGTAEALDAVASFLRRYHADDAVLYESAALTSAVDILARDDAHAPMLEELLGDPFTAPGLRDYIGARVRQSAVPNAPDVREHPPEIAALSTPGL